MESKEISLIVGGKYHVKISDDDKAEGVFKGYSSIGSEIAVVIELVPNSLRFIPVSQIRYIDQIKLPETEDEPKKVDIYYR